MRKLKQLFQTMKLNHKITVLIIGTIVIPMVILAVLLFQNMRESIIKEKVKNVEISINQSYNHIQKNVELCHMSTQVILNSEDFWDKLIDFQNSKVVDKNELLEFSRIDVRNIERLVNSNPYLYQIRIYIPTKKVPEMMPILYHMDRLDNFDWYEKEDSRKMVWNFDYVDTIFPYYVLKPSKHIVSLTTKVRASKKKINALIEVATKMDVLFPDIYEADEEQWTCFVDEQGTYFYGEGDHNQKWVEFAEGVFKTIPKDTKESYYYNMYLDEEPVVVGYIPLEQFNGHLLKIVSLKKAFQDINEKRNVFLIGFFGVVAVLIFAANFLVRLVLRDFYRVIHTVTKVKEGDLAIRVPVCSSNEIGQLSGQINDMMDTITSLMEDQLKRELLVKDSEIRALQNQINAHFIYNVLESIKMMAEVEERYDIADAVTSLGKLLRYSMKWVSKNVTVREEVDYIKNYLALINLRFDYEIYLSINMPEIIWSQEIPKMSLQPIIENAICHGIEEIAENTSIYMKGIVFEDYCTIEITDSGKGMSEEEVRRLQRKISGEIETSGSSGNGIGLKNVQDRIKISFGEPYGISVASREGLFTKVIVKIPLILR